MPRQKYDRPALKMEFFESPIDEVKGFLSEKGMKYNSKMATNTKGWTKEKEEHKNKILEGALALNAKKQAKELEIPMEQLSLAKKNAVVKVVKQMMEKDLDLVDLERTIKIIRTEMGLPTTYSKNENLNMEKFEGIDIVWVKNDKQ